MESIFKKLDDSLIESEKLSLDNVDKLTDVYNDLSTCIDLLSDVLELINSQDRAPKKKIKPIVKKLQSKMLDILEDNEKIVDNLDNSENLETSFFDLSMERLNAIDSLYNDYKHYKMIHIDEFLDRLDKLIY
jgi:hypothetical protein